jgi:hypothetical protein
METRDISLGAEGITGFDYYLDYKGNVFDSEGGLLSSTKDVTTAENIGYLGFDTTEPGLTPEAREAYLEVFSKQTATVLQTGTGWLRVRETPALNAEEVGRVDVGKTYTVLGTQTGWVHVKVSPELSGWVSADYVQLSE